MEAVKKAKERLKKYPVLILECQEFATAYATCVANKWTDVKKDDCKKEFDSFKTCVAKAAAKHNTRL